jgi:hypothetical protein
MGPVVLLEIVFSRATHLASGVVTSVAALAGMNAGMPHEMRSGRKLASATLALECRFFLLSLHILVAVFGSWDICVTRHDHVP